jgi:hypothetical protein
VAARRGGKVVEVAQGHVLPPRHVVEHAVKGAAAFGRGRRRYRAVERVAADLVTDPAGHQGQGIGRAQPALQPVELFLCLGLARADEVDVERRKPPAENRWVVERTFFWFERNRRLAKDFENPAETRATFVTVASVQQAPPATRSLFGSSPVALVSLPTANSRCRFG